MVEPDALARRARRIASALAERGRPGAAALLLVELGDPPGADVAELERATAQVLRPGDALARLDAQRVVVLCDRLEQARDAEDIGHRVERAVTSWLRTDGGSVQVRVRVAPLGTGDDPLGDLDAWADLDGPQRRDAARRGRLRDALQGAEDGLELRYQPVVSLRTGRVDGVEALVRWRLDGALVPPDDFVPLAEEDGTIVAIGSWVLRTAGEQVARWQQAPGAEQLRLAVNVSPLQLADEEFADVVAAVVDPRVLHPGTLWLEITERLLLDDLELAAGRLERLGTLGARIALDDFGTGWSSLSYLRSLPVDAVKLDRSFVSGLGRDDGDAAIVGAVVGLAHELGKVCIAEGVERPEQLELLRRLGCDAVQGTLVAAPLEPAELEHLLSGGEPLLLPG